MTRLLHISSSPRGAASESLAIAATFVDSYRDTHPDDEVDIFDLWDGSLPEFGPAAAAAKMTVFAGEVPTGAQAAAWQAAQDTFARFAAADHYLFSVPMWNAGMPYILKQFIDVVSQPGMVFGFDPEDGYTGLLSGKKAAVVYTGAVWGADRGPAFGQDFQQPSSTTGCAGPASPTSPPSGSNPIWPPLMPTPGAAPPMPTPATPVRPSPSSPSFQ